MKTRFDKTKIYRKGLAEDVSKVEVKSYKTYAKKGHTTNIIKQKDVTISDYPEGKEVYRFCISSENIDRDGDIVVQKGINYDNYIKNPVVFWGHEWGSIPIGKVVSVAYDETEKKTYADVLLGSTQHAQDIETLVKEGIVQATSIGFRIKDWDYDDELDAFLIKQSELLELSLVGLPANQDAVASEEKSHEEEVKSSTITTNLSDTIVSTNGVTTISTNGATTFGGIPLEGAKGDIGHDGIVVEEDKGLSQEEVQEMIAQAIAQALTSKEPEEEEEELEEEEEVNASEEPAATLEEQLAAMESRLLDALQNRDGEGVDENEDPEPKEESEEDSGSNESDEDEDDESTPIIIISE